MNKIYPDVYVFNNNSVITVLQQDGELTRKWIL